MVWPLKSMAMSISSARIISAAAWSLFSRTSWNSSNAFSVTGAAAATGLCEAVLPLPELGPWLRRATGAQA